MQDVNPNVQLVVEKLEAALGTLAEGGAAAWPVLAEETARRSYTMSVGCGLGVLLGLISVGVVMPVFIKKAKAACDSGDDEIGYVLGALIFGLAGLMAVPICMAEAIQHAAQAASPNITLLERVLGALK